MNAHPPRRGFSLVELMVAMAIGAVVVAGAAALMLGQQRHFQSTSSDRALQEAARIALGRLGEDLRQAGFGVDPALVFDFGDMANVRMDRAAKGAAFSVTSADPKCTATPVACRDSTAGPDEISFLSRDPLFGPHPLMVAATSGSATLKIAGPVKTTLAVGQVLQVLCYTGSMTWAYVQVAGPTITDGSGDVTIPIAPGATTFPRQNGSLDEGCYSATAIRVAGKLDPDSLVGAAKVFKVDRFRYYIQSYDDAGAPKAWGTAGARPYLMLDQGLSDADGPIQSVVAPDVEDLQVAYIFPNAAADRLVGATAGTALAAGATGIDLVPPSPTPAFSDDPAAPTRLTHHPGNIRGVQVSLVIRAPAIDPRISGDPIPAAGNRAAVVRNDGFRRVLVETTVSVRNLGMLAPYYPSYDLAGATQINAGGG